MGQQESKILEEEKNKVRREERGKAEVELRNTIGRLESQFKQELKKVSDANLKREKEQQQVINKLEQQEKKCSSLVESLRSSLAETQQQLVAFDKRVRQLETQVLEEQHVSASTKIRAEELEDDVQRVTKELESEKAEREEALAKISALENVVSETTKDLDLERQRLKGAREKIMNLEKQLRAFCTTTEEIMHLFDKQQTKLEEMHKALQEKQNEQITASTEIVPSQALEHNGGATIAKETETTSHATNGTIEPNPTSSVEREGNDVGVEASSDDDNVRETHDQV